MSFASAEPYNHMAFKM
uniref:Uncharacterized protein n=1 Tax=Anguilla anguilla TaxID=7936 RepID=A0A0E9SZN6_ANGAN